MSLRQTNIRHVGVWTGCRPYDNQYYSRCQRLLTARLKDSHMLLREDCRYHCINKQMFSKFLHAPLNVSRIDTPVTNERFTLKSVSACEHRPALHFRWPTQTRSFAADTAINSNDSMRSQPPTEFHPWQILRNMSHAVAVM
jgi:hypothetical protein